MGTRYQTAEGKMTTVEDPDRLVWYGQCGCWTDNWTALKKSPEGIPLCPKHGGVGFQAKAGPFIEHGVRVYGGGDTGAETLNSFKLGGAG